MPSVLEELVTRVTTLESDLDEMRKQLASRASARTTGYSPRTPVRTNARHTTAKFPSRCPGCSRENETGDAIFYVPKGNLGTLAPGAYCTTCHPEP